MKKLRLARGSWAPPGESVFGLSLFGGIISWLVVQPPPSGKRNGQDRKSARKKRRRRPSASWNKNRLPVPNVPASLPLLTTRKARRKASTSTTSKTPGFDANQYDGSVLLPGFNEGT